MPEEYTKLAEGIIKGSVPMVASFVERYVSEDEPGFFVGDREHIDGDIRVHVTLFAYLDQPDARAPEPSQLGVVDLQQLPEERVWMVVGGQPVLLETETWLNDLYSAMIRRMAARLVQFGFLDAPHRPRLRAASTIALAQVAQALRPPKPAPAPEPVVEPLRPAQATEPIKPVRVAEPVQVAEPVGVAVPVTAAATPTATPAAQVAPSQPAFAAASLSPEANPLNVTTGPQFDLMLTAAMVLIWLVACGMLSYLLVLLLR
jgi:hypothetical protein